MRVLLDSSFENWILGGIIRESAEWAPKPIKVSYLATRRSKAPIRFIWARLTLRNKFNANDLIVNQKTLNFAVQNKIIRGKELPKLRCFYTHDSEDSLKKSDTLSMLMALRKVLVMNLSDQNFLHKLGIPLERIVVVYGAVDRKVFFPLKESPHTQFVLITGDAKGRKNPQKLIAVVKENPEIDFVICGRYWEKFYPELGQMPQNLKITNYSLESNSLLMRNASTLLVLSLQEGGPYPILESLASGTPVVSTPVGWAPELIDSKTGIIVSQSATVQEISVALQSSMKLKLQNFHKDLLEGRFTWEQLAEHLYDSCEN
jgi:glycosyltransferase involved in cell wall biosynthesis